MSTEPELLYVNSKITVPSKLSPELFTEWYNDIHIPDIFKTSGIKQAYRYVAIADDSSKAIERPYLALYPVKFKGYFTSTEFYTIPITSDVLPGPEHDIFSFADFDTRYYNASPTSPGQKCYQTPYLLTIQIDNPTKEVTELVHEGLGTAPAAMRTYQCYFSRQNRLPPEESELGTPPSDLALLWFETEDQLHAAAAKAQNVGKVAKFKLLKAFADTQQNGGNNSAAL